LVAFFVFYKFALNPFPAPHLPYRCYGDPACINGTLRCCAAQSNTVKVNNLKTVVKHSTTPTATIKTENFVLLNWKIVHCNFKSYCKSYM